ncbi:MAG: hypothetical protein EXS12_01755 [Phycisphaerales bacterium]|nr:hypothetical protein [Phycisphaerales bacterium]
MIIATLLLSVLCLQTATATWPTTATAANKPTAIAVTKVANIGPTIDVPADLAALVPSDAVAVIFMPNAAAAESLATQLASVGGPMRGMVAPSKAIQTLLKTNLKTELEIPMDQPLVFWITMSVADENDPNQDAMGGPDIRSYMAMKIPGATKDNVKSKTKRTSLALLANDMVVVGAQRAAYEMPNAGAATCALLKQLPVGAVSGRLDLATFIREQENNLRMGASLIGMALSSNAPLSKNATQEGKEYEQIKEQMSAAMSDQATHLIDLLTELKSASFCLATSGDQLNVWTDWTRDAAWPEGMTAQECAADLALLPAGMSMYAGLSKRTLAISLNKQITFDDAMMNIAATPEQKQAWTESVEKTYALLDMMNSGAAIGVGDIGGKPGFMVGFRVKDAPAFQDAWQAMMETFSKTGLYSDTQFKRTADSLTTTSTPNVKRMKRLASAFGQDVKQEQIDAIEKSAKPVTTIMNFKGNNVTMVITPDMGVDAVAFKAPNNMDIRGQINANAWGNTDWFATLDLRVIAAFMAAAETNGFTLPEGPASMVSIRQGVQGGTQRISISTDMKSLATFMEQYEKETMRVRLEARKKMSGSDAASQDAEDAAASDASMPGAP